MINVQIQLKGLDKVENLLGRIHKQMPRVADQTVGDVGKEATKVIRKAVYQGRIHPPLFPMTMRKREMGKLAGPGGPAIPKFGSKKVLFRSGSMAKAIRYRHRKRGHWQMDIDPVPGEYSGGKQISLAHIAYLQETGFSVKIPVTYRMLRYLHVLSGKGTRSGGRRGFKAKSTKPDGKTGKVISVNVVPRPVFTSNFDQISESKFDDWLEASLRKRFKVF